MVNEVLHGLRRLEAIRDKYKQKLAAIEDNPSFKRYPELIPEAKRSYQFVFDAIDSLVKALSKQLDGYEGEKKMSLTIEQKMLKLEPELADVVFFMIHQTYSKFLESQREVLNMVCENEGLNKYQIEQRSRYSRPVVYDAVARLSFLGLIVKTSKEGSRGIINYYSASELGRNVNAIFNGIREAIKK